MSLNQDKGLIEKLEHSTFIDLLSIFVYGYFAYVLYHNVDMFDRAQLFDPLSLDLTVKAFQLAGVLIIINVLMFLHDRVKNKSQGIH